jgi:hypothetical protein
MFISSVMAGGGGGIGGSVLSPVSGLFLRPVRIHSQPFSILYYRTFQQSIEIRN